MEHLWSQKSSVNRDFTLLSAVIVFIALLTCAWVTYETYTDQSRKISAEMEQEVLRIERGLKVEIERASHLLEAIGRQILQRNTTDKTVIAQMLRAFDTNSDFFNVFVWIDEDMQAVTSSRQGIFDQPVAMGELAHILKSKSEPFKIHLGHAINRTASERVMIPLAMGLTDYTGKYIGTVVINLDLLALTKAVQEYVRSHEVGFAILDENLGVLVTDIKAQKALESSIILSKLRLENPVPGQESILTQPSLLDSNRVFSYYRYPASGSMVLLTLYTSEWNAFNRLILPRLMQLGLVAAFLVALLWLVRFRIIYPVQTLATASAEIARGNTNIQVPDGGPSEIMNLSRQLQNMVAYIGERKRIEEELIAKVLALKTAKDIAEISDQAKMEILRALRQETFPAMEQVLSTANLLQEQPYGPIKTKEYQDAIARLDKDSTHLAELLHEVFEFPRQPFGDPILTRKPVDIGAVLHKCVALLSATLAREEVATTIRVPAELPRLAINELHLTHVVTHLLLACARSIPAGGDLTVEAALEQGESGPEFAIIFKDNGTGLDTQQIAQLWRSNEYAHKNVTRTHTADTDTAGGATAIALTKKIISLHNGRMTMQNPPGKEGVVAVYFAQ